MFGPVKTRNRMLKTANGTSSMEDDQTCGPRMVAYYERLAKGGVGFLVDEYGAPNYENRTLFLRNCIAEAKRRCGPNFAVHCLFNICGYNHPKAMTIEEGVEMAAVVSQVADGINLPGRERHGHRQGSGAQPEVHRPVERDRRWDPYYR